MDVDDRDDLKPALIERLADTCAWLRLPVMIVFMVVLYIAIWVVGLVALVQFVIRLLTGESDARVRKLGHCLSLYLAEVVAYLTFRSDTRPYPWNEWPCGDDGTKVAGQLPPPAPEAKAQDKPAAKKAPRRKPRRKASPAASPDAPPDPE